jgi:DNA-directed RNA polymerase subunit M/transcription elongation factor TFIIS
MTSLKQDKDYVRNKGVLSLKTVLNKEQNIKIIEKCIHQKASKMDNYNSIYNIILYQIIGDIIVGVELESLIKNIKSDSFGWNHYMFTDIKNRITEHDEFIINPFEVEEGVTTCHCGSGRVFTYQKQTRGADEPMTTFAKCVKCKTQWTYSG